MPNPLFATALALSLCGSAWSLDLPDMTVPNSLGIQLKSSEADYVAQVAQTGARFMRRGFYWDAIEKTKGTYDFTGYDALIDQADKLGVRLVGCLMVNNKSLYEPVAPAAGRGLQTDAGRAGYAAFAAACAAHFKGRNIYWEIWNEPNVQSFWHKGKHNSDEFADEYSKLVLLTAPAMVKADPGCFVMAGSVSNYWEPVYHWTEACFKLGVLQSGIRAWSVHPYGVGTPEEHVSGGGGGHERMRALMRQYNRNVELPLITSERGFSVTKTKEGWSGGSEERAEEFQAWHFVRQYLVDVMSGVRATVWYEWGGAEFGFLGKDDKPRPIYHACTTLVKQLSGFTYVKRLDGAPLDYLLEFSHPDGRHMLVAWTAPEHGKTPDQAKDHTVPLPAELQQAGKTIDLFGGESPLPEQDGKKVVMLHGAPQYIAY